MHWCGKAPFKDQYQPNQQPKLISESPVLHMNSTQGFFKCIILDLAKVPYLSVDELMAWLTMAASFLNLDHANQRMQSSKQKNVVKMMDIAVKRFDLKEHLKKTFAEEISGGKKWKTVEGGASWWSGHQDWGQRGSASSWHWEGSASPSSAQRRPAARQDQWQPQWYGQGHW